MPNQSTAELDYRVDTGSDDNLMPINMFKTIFPRTPITELNRYINRIGLHAYDNSSIQQLGVYRVTVKHKDIILPYKFLLYLEIFKCSYGF